LGRYSEMTEGLPANRHGAMGIALFRKSLGENHLVKYLKAPSGLH